MSLNFGLGFSGVGLGLGIGNTKNANRIIARKLTSGEDVLLTVIGDSRTAQRNTQRFDELLCQSVPIVTWGGAMLQIQAQPRVGKYTLGSTSLRAGDGRQALSGTLTGRYADEFFPGEQVIWVDTEAVVPNIHFFAYLNNKFSLSNLPLLFNRANSLGLSTAKHYTQIVGGVTPPAGILGGWAVDTLTSAGQVFGSPINPVAGGNYILESEVTGINYGTGTLKTPTLAYVGDTLLTVGTTVFTSSIVKACPGVTVHGLSIAGRTIEGWLNENNLSNFHLRNQIPALSDKLGTSILLIDLGQNNTSNNNKDSHKAKLRLLINRWRAETGGYWVILTTQYKNVIDTVGVPTYYALACQELSREMSGVALFDTQEEMGEYSNYVAGMNADGIHLETSGRTTYLAPAINNIIERYAA